MEQNLQLNLSGGMNRRVTPLVTRDEECELAVNYVFDKVGGISKRKGYDLFKEATDADKPILGLVFFNELNSSLDNYIWVANNSGDTQAVIYEDGGVTVQAGSVTKSDDTADVYADFTTFLDHVFRTNGEDVVATTDSGTSWGTDNAPATLEPKYCDVFQDRVYVANNTQSNGESSRVYFSSLPSSGAITWDTTNDWFDVNPDDGDEITALENNGNRLLIFKHRSLYRWTFGQVEPDRMIGVGTSSFRSVQTNFDIGITFFANHYGVYAYSGGRPKLISRKIQDIIDAVTDWTDVAGGIDNDHYYLSVGDISLEGRSFSNVVLCYHISLDAWSMHEFAHKPTYFANMPYDDGASGTTIAKPYELYFGASDSQIYRMGQGYDDAGETIAAEFRSKEYMLGFPNQVDISRVDVFASKLGTTQVLMDVDRYGEPVVMGELQRRVTNLRPADIRRGNSVRVYFIDNSNTESVVEGFNVEYKPVTRRDQTVRRSRQYGN